MGAWTGTVKTWTAGETLLASDFNDQIRDPIAALSGAWTSYTPTLSGFTAGNGVAAGKYLQVGKLVIFRATFTFGTTSAAATATPLLSLPATAATSALAVGYATFGDSGTNVFLAAASLASTAYAAASVIGTDGAFELPTTTSPFTWTTNDSVTIGGVYEAA